MAGRSAGRKDARVSWRLFCVGIMTALLVLWGSPQGIAQVTFNSGSDGSDGELTLTTPGTVAFFALPGLDADGDGIYHFTTITIGEGVTVDMTGISHSPATWLASGQVRVDGIITLNGRDGESAFNGGAGGLPGAGGWSGGSGASGALLAQSGRGPGAAQAGNSPINNNRAGAGGGHAVPGGNGSANFGNVPVLGGPAYGNAFLLPLLGGSGGSGGGNFSIGNGGGGGGGGGALLIASSLSIEINGTIQANGGSGGNGSNTSAGGGGGSGGSLRLRAPVISGVGVVSVQGGVGVHQGGDGSPGRIRLEGQGTFSGTLIPVATPTPLGPLTLPTSRLPVRITRVGEIDVPEQTTGSLTTADVVVDTASPVTLEIAAQGVPLGTVVRVSVLSETAETIVVESTPLEGTVESSTATATVTIPHGFVHFLVEAIWTP